MNFYEFMQTKIKQTDIVGFIAREMSMDTKLFPSLELKNLNALKWQKRIVGKIKTSEVQNYVKAGFETAVKEFEQVKL